MSSDAIANTGQAKHDYAKPHPEHNPKMLNWCSIYSFFKLYCLKTWRLSCQGEKDTYNRWKK